jgi:acyl-CoA synthetase (AMP-forming)/AMP-acid ligase II
MLLEHREPDDILLRDGESGDVVTTAHIREAAHEIARSAPRLCFLFADLSLLSITRFLALLEAGVPVLPLDPATSPAAAQHLLTSYSPDLVFAPRADSLVLEVLVDGTYDSSGGWQASARQNPCHDDLSVLLSTSGSTGSPKLVRLSRRNIVSNAQAIAESLSLTPDDRVVTSLPIFYSFGMSLITSHIIAGSSVVVTGRSVIDRQFWEVVDDHRVTHLAGVPATYAMLKRLRFFDRDLPHLRALLQAGGRLDAALVEEFAEDCATRGRRFYVMYGQTEASPRMSCLPADRVLDKRGSVGLALNGGRFEIESQTGPLPAGAVGEVVYSGPNVMLGYAESRADLARGDDTGGTLHTGDLGYLDDEGFLFITGRLKRIAKISGARVSLDDLERMLGAIAPVAVVAAPDDGVVIFTCHPDSHVVTTARKDLARSLGAPPTLLKFEQVDELPTLSSGKVDYQGLTARAARDDAAS